VKASRNFRNFDRPASKTLQTQLVEKGLVPPPLSPEEKEKQKVDRLKEFLSSKTKSELIYDNEETIDIIRMAYPHAKFEDARDMIHDERFEVLFGDDGPTTDEFYRFACREGFARGILGFELSIRCMDGFAKYILEYMKSIRGTK